MAYLSKINENLHENKHILLKIILKWECDNSQQKKYKQKFDFEINSDLQVIQSLMVLIWLNFSNIIILSFYLLKFL